jgi:predicted alpha/beta-fold hydrolase
MTDLAANTIQSIKFSKFVPRMPWWGGHLQTIATVFAPRVPELDRYRHSCLAAPVGDGTGDRLVATLHYPAVPTPTKPVIMLIHGVAGSEDSEYMLSSAAFFLELGYPVLRCNLRGAGRSRPVCKRQYHAGSSEDLAHLIGVLPPTLAAQGVVGIAYSLGGNILLKFLGERRAQVPMRGAVTVSSPLELQATARQLRRWDNTLYQAAILGRLKSESVKPSSEVTTKERLAVAKARTVWEFDDSFTAPRNGFSGAADYYDRSSCRQFLEAIAVPTLLIYALDDPLVPRSSYLDFEWRRNPHLVSLLSRGGGHVGFRGLDRHVAWHDRCAAQFVEALPD